MLFKAWAHIFYSLFILLTGLFLYFFGDMPRIYRENGAMETIQVIEIFMSGVIFFIGFVRIKSFPRYLCGVLGTICFAFMLRELDVETFALPQWIILLGSGNGRMFLLIPFSFFVYRVFQNVDFYKAHFFEFLHLPLTRYLIVAACMLVAGIPVDRKWLVFEHNIFFEEMFELAGYYYLLIASVLAVDSLKLVKTHES